MAVHTAQDINFTFVTKLKNAKSNSPVQSNLHSAEVIPHFYFQAHTHMKRLINSSFKDTQLLYMKDKDNQKR